MQVIPKILGMHEKFQGEYNAMMGLMPGFKYPLSLLLGAMKLLFHVAAQGVHFLGIDFLGKIEWFGKVDYLSREG